jgi:diguanylate cyclase
MSILLPLLIGAVAGGLLGLCIGWLARGRDEVVVEKVVTQTVEKIVERTADDMAQKRDQANEILTQLQSLTSGVSAKIDAHSRTVGVINDELTHAGGGEAGAVVNAIKRLVDSNNAMQSQLQVAQTQLQQQANLLEVRQEEARTDALTKLRNRRAFDDELARRAADCAAGKGSLSLMMLDVDHFKKCNDNYTHLAGDEVLRMVGRVLAEGARENPGLFAARYGGEEFALLFSDLSLDAAAQLGDQIRREIGQTSVQYEGKTLVVSASAGVTAWQRDERLPGFISRADEALYAAKKAGRNRTCLHDDGRIRNLAPGTNNPLAAEATELDSPEAMNRTINRRIAEWRRGGVVLSLIVARIDNLAALDAQGIRERERAMLQAGDLLKKTLREMDQIALMSGEILGMLLPAARIADAARIAERMRGAVDRGELDQSLGTRVTMSFGVAEVTADDDGDALVLRARRALEAARRRGGNAVYVNDGVYSTPAQDVLDVAAAKCVTAQ